MNISSDLIKHRFLTARADLLSEISSPAWKRSLILWLALNVLLTGMGALIWKLQGPVSPGNSLYLWGSTPIEEGLPGALEGMWLRWDAVHYRHIAQYGYDTDISSAFFPLFPLLGRAIGNFLGGHETAGMLMISRLAFLLALVLLYKMCAERFDDETATLAILFAALHPLGVYWFAPYPLSLALLFTLVSMRGAMQKRWLLAALAGLAAGLTHATTIPLILGLFTLWLMQMRGNRRAWMLLPAVATPALGVGLFFSYRIRSGLPQMDELLKTHWQRAMQPPWMVVGDFERFYLSYMDRPDGWVNLALFLFGVFMVVVCIRRLDPPLWIYYSSLVIYICSTVNYSVPFGSYGRYLMMAFPSFIILPTVIKGKRLRLFMTGLSLLIMGLMSIVYFEWGWVA